MLTSESDDSLNNYFNICLLVVAAVALKVKVPPTPSPLPTASSTEPDAEDPLLMLGCHRRQLKQCLCSVDCSPEELKLLACDIVYAKLLLSYCQTCGVNDCEVTNKA